MLTFLIDDNTIDLFLNQRMLELSGLETEFKIFSSSADALAFFKEKPDGFIEPDLVLLDIQMPDYNGFQLLELLFEIYNKNLPFRAFLLSSTINASDLREADKFSPKITLLEKPLNPEMLKKHLSLA